jgi:uroporphyrinogen-III synthase
MNEAERRGPIGANAAASLPLRDWLVVVTRPQPAAEQTAQVLREAGARVLVAPMLEIAALPTDSAKPVAEQSFAASVFVSVAAVEHGLIALGQRDRKALGAVLAVGAATARRLAEKGIVDVYAPDAGEDSEALLADARLAAVSGNAILIVRGQSDAGGRRLLADTLRARGAVVTELVCYERRPTALSQDTVAALRGAVSEGAAVLFGSVETIESFVRAMPPSAQPLATVQLALVPHPRIAAVAQQLGAQQTRLVSLADNKLVASMLSPVA